MNLHRQPLAPQVRDNRRGALSFSRATTRDEGIYICSAGDIRREAVVRVERRRIDNSGRGRDDRGRRRGKDMMSMLIFIFSVHVPNCKHDNLLMLNCY